MASAKYADATDLNAAIAQTTGQTRQISVQSPATIQQLASSRLHPRPERRIVPRVHPVPVEHGELVGNPLAGGMNLADLDNRRSSARSALLAPLRLASESLR